MTAPRFSPCRCGHAKADHETLPPQCSAMRCVCLNYRPEAASQAPPVTAPAGLRAVPTNSAPPSLDQLLAAARRSDVSRTVKLAQKIDAELADLRGRLNDERDAVAAKQAVEAQKEAARAEVTRLERQLAAAKAKLRGKPALRDTRNAERAAGTGVCPDCGRDGLLNVGAHRTRAHGFRVGGVSA